MNSRGVSARARWGALAVGVAAVCSSVSAQTPTDHESHHPRSTEDSPLAVDPSSTSTSANAPGAPAEMAGMGSSSAEMGGMHEGGVGSRELYPAMIELPSLTPESKAEIDRLARERFSSGAALLSSAMEDLLAATDQQDLPRVQQVVPRLRQGVEQVETGAASLRALSEGQPPRAIAIRWFKDRMQLSTADIATPHGIFGLSVFHYFTMVLLGGTTGGLLWMRLARARRARALVSRLAGVPPATQSPAPSAKEAPALAAKFAPVAGPPSDPSLPSRSNAWTGLLRVARIFDETTNVRTLRLVDPAGGEVPFRHLPGQFLTFTVRPLELLVKRSYTIASSPTRRDYLEVTVKREEHGTVSSFLHDVHQGDTLQVTGPSGSFTFVGEGANSIVLISGGVGITPMMSVLRYLTDRSWSGEIFFVHGCKSDRDLIYRDELEYLQRRYPTLKLLVVTGDASSEWPHVKGQLSADLLGATVPHIHTRRVHLCGPPGMMTALKGMLAELGVPADQVRTEVFIGKERPVDPRGESVAGVEGIGVVPAATGWAPPLSTPPAVESGVAVVTFARSQRTALLPKGRTVLEASEDVGVNIDYSCRVGVCGVCKVKLLSGTVTMEVEEGLDASDRQLGLILSCQAKSSGDISVDA